MGAAPNQVQSDAQAASPESSQAAKLETIGRLTSGVAHDFANILTLISGYTEILLERSAAAAAACTELEEIRRAANRGATLVAQLLGFARTHTVAPKALSLNAVVTDIERMLRPLIGEGIQVRLDLDPEGGKVLADSVQMDQVFMNILLNARDAMPAGGFISIMTRNGEIDANAAALHEMTPGQVVTICISDTGPGIDPSAMPYLFEPFFTTKSKGKGSGLGLSTVREIVRGCGGSVWASSGADSGAAFHICLPRIPPVTEVRETAVGPKPSARGTEVVLVVEDENSVRRLLTQVLRMRGYQVLEACDGEEALALFGEQGDAIQLVLTDVIMPKMGGPDLADRLLAIRPDLPLIFVSGYPDDRLAGAGALPPGVRFLRKPVLPEALACAVRETLDSASRPFNPQ